MVILTPFSPLPRLSECDEFGGFFPAKKFLLVVPTLWFLFAKSVLRKKDLCKCQESQKLQ
jgi:hypothetical protein